MKHTILLSFEDDTMTERRGVLLNSHWSDAHGCWFLLVSCDTGAVMTVRSDLLGLKSAWIEDDPAVVLLGPGDDLDEPPTEDFGPDDSF